MVNPNPILFRGGYMRFLFVISLFIFNLSSHALIIGEDDRRPIEAEDAAKRGLKPVTYLLTKKQGMLSTCTATWISKTHLLTARHCVATSEKALIYNQYQQYLAIRKAHVKKFYVSRSSSNDQNEWYGALGNSESRPSRDDWAVLEIHEEQIKDESDYELDENGNPRVLPNGRKVINMQKYGDGSMMGYLPILPSNVLDSDPTVKVGAYHYDADNYLYLQYCRYHPRTLYAQYRLMYRPGMMEIDCDMMSGASGASLQSCSTGKCGIVGIFSGEYLAPDNGKNQGGLRIPEFSFIHSNTATKSDNFIGPVTKLLKGDTSEVKAFNLKKANCKLVRCLQE